jgi:ligand-binding sensor domain-containing protein/signal transduction histidine kinase
MSIGVSRRVSEGWLSRLALWAALTLSPALHAAPLTLRFEHVGVDQGLTQESVTAILQDRHGYMWLGTQAGLNRYDGYRMTVFKSDPTNPRSVLDNYIQVLFEDDQGGLWVGSKGGLDRYDPATQTFIHHLFKGDGGAGNLTVSAIASDGKQGLWLATSDGLQHFDTLSGKAQLIRHDATPGSIVDDHVAALVRDGAGNLWVGTSNGLDVLPAGGKTFLHAAAASGTAPSVLSLSLGADGVLWAGTTAGLQTWKMQDRAPLRLALPPSDTLSDQRITALRHDRDGTLWIGTFADGLKRRDPANGHYYSYRRDTLNRHSIGDNQVSAVYQDRTGTLWVGNWYAGADRVDLASGGFERFTEFAGPLPSISNNKVRAVTSAGDHKLWLGTADGLTRLDLATGGVEVWRKEEHQAGGLPGNLLMSLDTDQQGRLWIGTTTGLARRDPASGVITPVALSADPNSQSIQRVLVDRSGVIWVVSRSGLHRIDQDSGAVRSFVHDGANPDSISSGRLYTVLEDHRGNLWLGGENGLDRLDRATGKVIHYRHDPRKADSLSHNRIHYLHEDASGRLWIGTATGLCMAQLDASGEPHFRIYSAENGHLPDPIGAILGDEQGRLWISSTSGISRFDPATGEFKDYTAKDGLIDGSYFIGAGYRSSDGTLYFGGLAGVTAFKPAQIHDNPYAPMVSITDFSIFNQSILSGVPRTDVLEKGPIYEAKALTLSYRDAVFSFEFAGMHHADPERNRYAYQLEGFDSHWVMTDSGKRFATYTNLDPGHYVFRVKAANKDGVWSTQPAALVVDIAPPFWGTWWFRAVLISLLLGGAYALFRIRIRLLVGQKQALELEVGARTRELVAQKESAERQKREAERQKEGVELAHRNISLLSDIGRSITANLDSEAIMSMLYQQVNELMDASVFGIGIYRPELEVIEYPFAMERGKRYTPYTRSMREPNQLAVWCITHARDVFINDVDQEFGRYIESLELVTGAEDMGTLEDGSLPTAPRSMIYVPISLGGHVRGVITVHSYRKHAYQRIDLDMLNTLASYVAVAIDNADAYRQLKDTQQQLVEREKLAALGALVAGVAHELNTPIGNSLVIASTMEDKTEDMERKSANETLRRSDLRHFIEASKEACALLMRSLRNAAELVNSFKQVAVDQASANRRPFNLQQASQEIVLTMMNQIRKAGHHMELEIPDDIVMDSFPGPYGQVIINLINNAMLHGFEGRTGGLMRLSAARMPGERVRITFQDDGCGIDNANQARIFDPFFTTKLGQGGNGLGLSVTYNIVTSLLGGHIRVDSAVGIGTVFTIDLPLKAAMTPDL